MDRANLGNARVAGMSDDLGLSDTDFSLALNMFQISYIVFSPLSNTVLPRLRPSRYVSAIMLLWGPWWPAWQPHRTPVTYARCASC